MRHDYVNTIYPNGRRSWSYAGFAPSENICRLRLNGCWPDHICFTNYIGVWWYGHIGLDAHLSTNDTQSTERLEQYDLNRIPLQLYSSTILSRMIVLLVILFGS